MGCWKGGWVCHVICTCAADVFKTTAAAVVAGDRVVRRRGEHVHTSSLDNPFMFPVHTLRVFEKDVHGTWRLFSSSRPEAYCKQCTYQHVFSLLRCCCTQLRLQRLNNTKHCLPQREQNVALWPVARFLFHGLAGTCLRTVFEAPPASPEPPTKRVEWWLVFPTPMPTAMPPLAPRVFLMVRVLQLLLRRPTRSCSHE